MSESQMGCPGVSAYRDLLRGDAVPDGEALLDHLGQCPVCQRTVRSLDDALSHAAPLAADCEARRRAREIVERALGQFRTTDLSISSDLTPPPQGGFLSAAQTPDELGRLGGYRILGILGRGGMGIVFEAEDAGLRRRVALKVMKPEIAANPQQRERFLREARAMASVVSDHVCPIFQVGEDNGVPFMAMPLLEGEPLDLKLHREMPLPVVEAARIGREIALGLGAAHQKGIIHRDVKPGNVWLEKTATGTPRARLLDFGLARGGETNLTVHGEVMGTPAYSSLEQARGQPVDSRADLFSLGVILYEMLAGERPFTGADHFGILTSLAVETPQPPAERRPEVPAALSGLIMQLLAKSPEDRPADAGEVAARLAEFLAPAATTTATATKPKPSKRPVTTSPAWPRRLVWAAAVLLAIGGGLAAGVLFLQITDGTLIVEVDGEAQMRFQSAEIHVEGEDGKRTILGLGEKSKALPAGKYRVKLKGGSGLRLDREEVEITRRGTAVVRVLAPPPAPVVKRDELLPDPETEREEPPPDPPRMPELLPSPEIEEVRPPVVKVVPELLPPPEKEVEIPAVVVEAARLYREAMDVYLGQTKEADAERAMALFALAAQKGHAVASARLGWMIWTGQGPEKDEAKGFEKIAPAVATVWEQAERGDAEAQAILGMMLRDGAGIGRDDKDAFAWLRAAADQGHLDATSDLGEAYAFGRGVDRDEKKAAELYATAHKGGNTFATYNLGRARQEGRGVDKDEKKAVELFLEAARKGNALAMGWLGYLYENGRVVEKDEKKAVEWYKKAADRGDVGAMVNLGRRHEEGQGVEKDDKKAAELFRKADRKGSPVASFDLGRMYEDGRGLNKDADRAIELYFKAANKGVVDAMYKLGLLYEEAKFLDSALEWYKKAAARGDDDAKAKVEKLEKKVKKPK